MCGIVGYFGRAANSLTRVLTAMSAIIYRAPDSTGIGIFGDENEPVRARKATGSVIQLVDVLLKNPLYPNLPQELMGFFDSMADKSYLEERQLRLLIFEGLPTNYFLDLKKGKMAYSLFSELIDMDNPDPYRIAPGWPGRSNPLPSPVIESREDLQQVVLKLIQDYDLSTVVIKSFIRNALSHTIERRRKEGYLEVEASDILTAFDQVYEEILSEEKVPQAADFELESKLPFAVVCTSIRELAKVEMFSQNRCICLPSADPALQPFVDFVFFYMLSFHYGRAHGRSSDFPRNRAKSVTAGRNLLSEPASNAKEFHQLDFKARGIRLEQNVSDEWLSEETIWETTAESPLDPMKSFSDHSLIFLLDSRSHDIASIETLSENLPSGCIYVGPESDISRLYNPQGCCFFKEPFAFCESDLLYITVFLLFTEAIRKPAPTRAEILKKLMKKSCLGLRNIMENAALKNAINDSIASNSGYLSSFLIGPTGGIGDLWTDRFDQFSRMILQSYYYGESAHGPLVTIDPKVCDKYVRLGPRNIMVPIYGEEKVDEWEKRYLNGRSTDVFLNQSPNYLFYQVETPFFADGKWYFPVLRKDYDTIEDNLVILDATSERYLAHAQDEMSTFGARYARMVVISQEAFFGAEQKISLFKYPISHMLLLPPLFEDNKTMIPIPDLILPIAMSMISMAMTGATQKTDQWTDLN